MKQILELTLQSKQNKHEVEPGLDAWKSVAPVDPQNVSERIRGYLNMETVQAPRWNASHHPHLVIYLNSPLGHFYSYCNYSVVGFSTLVLRQWSQEQKSSLMLSSDPSSTPPWDFEPHQLASVDEGCWAWLCMQVDTSHFYLVYSFCLKKVSTKDPLEHLYLFNLDTDFIIPFDGW